MTAAEKLRRAAEIVREFVAVVNGQQDAEGRWCAHAELERLGFSTTTVALAVADWLDFEAKVMVLHGSQGRLFPVDRAERSEAVADAILAGVEG